MKNKNPNYISVIDITWPEHDSDYNLPTSEIISYATLSNVIDVEKLKFPFSTNEELSKVVYQYYDFFYGMEPTNLKIEDKILRDFKIPVAFEIHDTVTIVADSIEEAISQIKNNDTRNTTFPSYINESICDTAQYIEGSLKLDDSRNEKNQAIDNKNPDKSKKDNIKSRIISAKAKASNQQRNTKALSKNEHQR